MAVQTLFDRRSALKIDISSFLSPRLLTVMLSNLFLLILNRYNCFDCSDNFPRIHGGSRGETSGCTSSDLC